MLNILIWQPILHLKRKLTKTFLVSRSGIQFDEHDFSLKQWPVRDSDEPVRCHIRDEARCWQVLDACNHRHRRCCTFKNSVNVVEFFSFFN